jgi:hypothetical protein
MVTLVIEQPDDLKLTGPERLFANLLSMPLSLLDDDVRLAILLTLLFEAIPEEGGNNAD